MMMVTTSTKMMTMMAFFPLFACNLMGHLHPENPNYYQNHAIYAPERNDGLLVPFTRDFFYRTASLYQSSAFYICNMHAHLVILPIQITCRVTLEVMQTSYYNFKLLLFFSIYREVLQFQTKYIDRNYLTAHVLHCNVMPSQVVIYTILLSYWLFGPDSS